MTSYTNEFIDKNATDYIDWHTLKTERRLIERRLIAVSDTTYPEQFISNDDLRKYELAKHSQMETRKIGRRKQLFLFNTKGHLRAQYFNKFCLT